MTAPPRAPDQGERQEVSMKVTMALMMVLALAACGGVPLVPLI